MSSDTNFVRSCLERGQLAPQRDALVAAAAKYWRKHRQVPTAEALGAHPLLWADCLVRIERVLLRAQRGDVLKAVIEFYWEHEKVPTLAEISVEVGFLVSQEVFDTCGHKRPVDVIRRYKAIGGDKTEDRAQDFNRRITGYTTGPMGWEESWCDKLGIAIEPGTVRAARRLKALERGFRLLEHPRLGQGSAVAGMRAKSLHGILWTLCLADARRRHLDLVRRNEKKRAKGPRRKFPDSKQSVFLGWEKGVLRPRFAFSEDEEESVEKAVEHPGQGRLDFAAGA